MLRNTHTYATLDVSREAYNEIAEKLHAAGYDHSFGDDGEIDMHGIALVLEKAKDPTLPRPYSVDEYAAIISGGEPLSHKKEPEHEAKGFWHMVRKVLLW